MKMTISKRLSIGFGLVVLIILVNVILTSVMSHNNRKLNDEVSNVFEPSAALLTELNNQVTNS